MLLGEGLLCEISDAGLLDGARTVGLVIDDVHDSILLHALISQHPVSEVPHTTSPHLVEPYTSKL
jgi:hypothetical protein